MEGQIQTGSERVTSVRCHKSSTQCHKLMPDSPMNLFFLIGPPRSGSSLMSRCIDDHPQALCLCESEANRGLFSPFALKLHMNRMRLHGGKGKKGHCTYSEKQNVPFCDSPKAMALRLTPPLPRTGPKLPGPSESIVTSTPITDSYVANSPPTTIRVGSTALIAIGVTNCVSGMNPVSMTVKLSGAPGPVQVVRMNVSRN